MAATAAMVARLRRMVNEPTTATYSDDDLEGYIEEYPLLDADGNDPDEIDWAATYDLHAAAANIWEEKAAAEAHKFDFTHTGDGSFQRSYKYLNFQRQVNDHNARRAMRTRTVRVDPQPAADDDYVVNAAEDD